MRKLVLAACLLLAIPAWAQTVAIRAGNLIDPATGAVARNQIILVQDKAELMRKLGKRRLTLVLHDPLPAVPAALAGWPIELEDGGRRLSYRFDASAEDTGVPTLLRRLGELGVDFKDLETGESSLEDIFVDLVGRAA